MAALADADAFGSLELGRREGWWAVERLKGPPLPLFAAAGEPDRGPDPPVTLPARGARRGDRRADYRSVGLSLRGHPVALLREAVGAGITWSGALDRRHAPAPGSRWPGWCWCGSGRGPRRGSIFLTLEDMEGDRERRGVEPGLPIAFVSRCRARASCGSRGGSSPAESVVHVIAERIVDLSEWLGRLADGSAGGEGVAVSFPGSRAAPRRRAGRQAASRSHPRHEARRLFPSRDFH